MKKLSLLPPEPIETRILFIRAQKVIIDSDLAKLYGVSTKALNQAVKRNCERFPIDFMFELTKDVKKELVTNCDHLKQLKVSSTLPKVFTEHGAIMLASVLNSKRAVDAGIYVVRTFVNLRDSLKQKNLTKKRNRNS
jgi:2,3-bisphosphoglycerate-independent phosphoglycerate mutase